MRPNTAPKPQALEIETLTYASQLARLGGVIPEPVLQLAAKSAGRDDRDFGWRKRLAGKRFFAIDSTPGPGVDAVVDIAAPIEDVRKVLTSPAYGGVLCSQVLEQARDPFAIASRITALLAPGGLAFVQAPLAKSLSAGGQDRWRFTLSGLATLFEGLEIVDVFYSGSGNDVAYRIKNQGKADSSAEAQMVAARAFEAHLPQSESEQMVRKVKDKRHLSRIYVPVTVLNVLFRKPRS
jgi:hypothetical protein